MEMVVICEVLAEEFGGGKVPISAERMLPDTRPFLPIRPRWLAGKKGDL
jgi:hypothetical protein